MNNNDLLDTYIKYLQPTLIFEQDEELEDDDLDIQDADTDTDTDADGADDTEDDIQEDEVQQTEESQNDAEQNNATTSQKKSDTDLKFSADLASQFGNTVNKFTRAAAQVIKQRTINKEQSDNIYNLMGKIKDLLDAASKSV